MKKEASVSRSTGVSLDVKEGEAAKAASGGWRPWLGVHFLCAGVYQRVYKDPKGTGYTARCAKCGKCVKFRVGAGGTDQRFFEVSC